MDNKLQLWQEWARKLNQWGLAGPAVALLQAAGPLRILAAQVTYLGQPFMDPFLKRDMLNVLANTLESDSEAHSFIAYLRQEEKA